MSSESDVGERITPESSTRIGVLLCTSGFLLPIAWVLSRREGRKERAPTEMTGLHQHLRMENSASLMKE